MPSSMESLVYCCSYWLGKFNLDIWNMVPNCLMVDCLDGKKPALLRIRRNPWFNYKLYARRLYLIGLGVGASRITLLLVLHFKFLLVV